MISRNRRNRVGEFARSPNEIKPTNWRRAVDLLLRYSYCTRAALEIGKLDNWRISLEHAV